MKTKATSSSVDNYLQNHVALRWGNPYSRRAAYMTYFQADSSPNEQAVFTLLGVGGAR